MKGIKYSYKFGIVSVFLLSLAQPAQTKETDDRQFMAMLQNMANTIADAKHFSVTVSSSYDAPQANGQLVEFGVVRTIQLNRPNYMRVDLQRSDGDKRILVFDGKHIVYHNVEENVYTKTENPGDIDEVLKHLVGTLKIPLPLARMFRTNFRKELERIAMEINYVEKNVLTDEPTDHLAIRSNDVDFQIWITQGSNPLPRRLVITYKNFEGAPQYRANFSDWDLSVNAAKGPFTFSPPKNAEEVPLLVRDLAELSSSSPKGGAQ